VLLGLVSAVLSTSPARADQPYSRSLALVPRPLLVPLWYLCGPKLQIIKIIVIIVIIIIIIIIIIHHQQQQLLLLLLRTMMLF